MPPSKRISAPIPGGCHRPAISAARARARRGSPFPGAAHEPSQQPDPACCSASRLSWTSPRLRPAYPGCAKSGPARRRGAGSASPSGSARRRSGVTVASRSKTCHRRPVASACSTSSASRSGLSASGRASSHSPSASTCASVRDSIARETDAWLGHEERPPSAAISSAWAAKRSRNGRSPRASLWQKNASRNRNRSSPPYPWRRSSRSASPTAWSVPSCRSTAASTAYRPGASGSRLGSLALLLTSIRISGMLASGCKSARPGGLQASVARPSGGLSGRRWD